MIPDYLALYDQALKSVEADQIQLNWCDNITGLLKRLLGAEYNYNGRTQMKYEKRRTVSWGSFDHRQTGRGEVVISSYGAKTIDIKITDLDPDKAIKLLALYKQEIIDHESTT